MKKLLLFHAVVMLSVMTMTAQSLVRGKVVDKDSVPVVGVYVSAVDGGQVVATDINGGFEISAEYGSSLTFSMMGSRTVRQKAVDGMVVVMAVDNAFISWDWRKKEWNHFLLAEYGFNVSTMIGHSVGLRYGMCRYAGWYLGVRYLSSDFRFPDVTYTMEKGVIYEGGKDLGTPVLTGQFNFNQFSFSAGLLWRMGVPLYGYVGGGYGYRMSEHLTTGGAWVKNSEDKSNIGIAEVGLIGDIHYITISLGCEIVFAGTTEVYPKIGIGYTFPSKK